MYRNSNKSETRKGKEEKKRHREAKWYKERTLENQGVDAVLNYSIKNKTICLSIVLLKSQTLWLPEI